MLTSTRTFLGRTVALALLLGWWHVLPGTTQSPQRTATATATATVADWSWVNPVNPPGTVLQRFSNGDFPLSDTCGIMYGGSVTVQAEDEQGLLVRYTAPGPAGGTQCPSGVLFLLTREAFEAMTPAYEERQRTDRAQRERIQRLLKQR